MPHARLFLVLLLATGAVLPVGCFQAHNPTYFPNWGWEGRITRTHAKPAGRAYFKNFDPKACRIELKPLRCDNPVGTQQVLIASVVDADGMPRRSRRVEWIIDGPGYIVEVDESGWYSGRGYKVDNKYAVSYTDYREHAFTRGTEDPRDDFTIFPGQTWCVVSSAVEGQTTVTAYAPEVFDWQSGRTTAVLTWGPSLPGSGFAPPSSPGSPGGIVFPPPVVSRAGGEAALITSITPEKLDRYGDGLKVRYKVLDGPPAVLLAGASAGAADGSTVLYGSGRAEADVAADAAGQAVVTVRQPAAKPGTTRVAVEVVRPDPEGTGREVVVRKSETRIEWAAADLTLNLKAPAVAPLNQEVPLTLVMANVGKAESPPVTLRATVPEDAEFVRAEPPPTATKNRTLAWSLGSIAAGQNRPVTVTVRPTRKGILTVAATAETPDGLHAEQTAGLPVESAGMSASAELPPMAPVGDPFVASVSVTNAGSIPLSRVTAWLALDGGLTAADGDSHPELTIGTLAPGETRRAEVKLRADKTGRYPVRVNVTADGGLTARAEGAVEVRRTELTARIVGPKEVSLGREAAWDIEVTNAGDGPLPGVDVKASLPRGLRLASGANEWPVGNLAAGEKRTFRLAAAGDAIGEGGSIRVTAAADPKLRVTAAAETAVAVTGSPALTVELPDPPGVVPVGRRNTIRVVVRNNGDAPARQVELTVSASNELTLHGGTAPSGQPVAPDGSRLAFPPIRSLNPGATAVFAVDVGAAKPGTARLSAEVRADHLPQPVRDEQAARVVP